MTVQKQGSGASEGFTYPYEVSGWPLQGSWFSLSQSGLGVVCQGLWCPAVALEEHMKCLTGSPHGLSSPTSCVL